MRGVLLGALLFLTAACGAYQFPGASPSPATGTVSGHVLSVPCSPVEQAGDVCAGRAVAGLTVIFAGGASGQATTEQATTDNQGRYSIELPAGTWKVSFKTYMRRLSGPSSVTVTAGATTTADYVFDNGIRVPQPAPAG